jgi:hypothetical protein
LLGREDLVKQVLPEERELLYCLRLFFERSVRGLAHFSGYAGFRARNCTSKFALRPDSSVVERGPEKAGVGGSIPSLATTFPLG